MAEGSEPTHEASPKSRTTVADGAVTGPLADIRVVELGALVAGPFAGRLLADFGADVIKIEAPGRPDPLRDWGHATYRGRHLWWPVQTRNKRCVTLNLKDERGRELFLRLVELSDVVIENFRPGTLERLGLGYDVLSERNPGLILARVSGYGQTGPYAARAGFAAVAEAMGGLRYFNGFPDRPPPRLGISLGDSLAGMFAVQGILTALHWRDAEGGGRGQVIDVSLVESCFALLESAVPEYDRAGVIREPAGTGLHGVVPSNVFKARDGKQLVIAANQDPLFRRLCEAMGRPELAEDQRFATHVARAQNREACEAAIAKWVGDRDSEEVDRVLNEAGVVCGPIYSVKDVCEDPHLQERGMLLEHIDHELGPILGPGIVPKLEETPGALRWSGPWPVGEHNDEIWGELVGVSLKQRGDLEREGVL